MATYILLTLLPCVVVLALLIVLVRGGRVVRTRRRDRLAAGPRRALLAFVAEGGAEGADELVAIPPRVWRAAEPVAIALLGKVRGEAHQALVAVFERRGAADSARRALTARSAVTRARAAETLGYLGRRDAVPGLCALLEDPYAETRVVAVRALGRIGDPAAAEPLLASLARAEPTPSHLVAHALIQIGSTAGPALTRALAHPDPLVRVTALDALSLIGAVASAGPVGEVLAGDPSLDVRVAAASALGKLGTRSAFDRLTHAARPAEPAVLRAAAARAMGDLGGAATVGPLAELLADPQYQVANAAAHALRRVGPAGLTELRRVAASGADRGGDGTRPAGSGLGADAMPRPDGEPAQHGYDAAAAGDGAAPVSDPHPRAGAGSAGNHGGGAAAHAREALAMAAVAGGSPEPEPTQTLAVVG